jgi:hypothetical protein
MAGDRALRHNRELLFKGWLRFEVYSYVIDRDWGMII